MPSHHAAIWFKDEATYLRFQKLCPDMGNTYNQWLKLATQQIAEIKRTVGIDMIKVEADPEQFAAWCKVNSCAPDGRSRSAYAGVKYGESRKISEN